MMREAVRSVLAQDYSGDIEVIVVFDKAEPDHSLEQDEPRRRVRSIANVRTSGLAGARNTGILAAKGSLVAFCDDDDKWLSEKLSTQVDALLARPDAEFATTAMLVNFEGRTSPRLAQRESVEFVDLLRSRMAMLHSSSFLVWRHALLDGIGLVDETLPRSMAEDWELLLRAARRSPIVNVDRPLVDVRWGASSYFADQWAVRNEAQLWLMEHYPEMLRDPIAAGLSYGKLAFGEAAQGHRREAFRWAAKAFRANPRELRLYIACGVAIGLVPAGYLLRRLNEHGHGI
jgi:glycosyltransferase involved in cell wall biosynthesis